MWNVIGVWIGAFFTLAIFSFLFKDNPVYRLAESIYVGLALGFGFAVSIQNVFIPRVWIPIFHNHQWLLLIPAAVGLLFFAQLVPKLRWLIRIPMAIFIGYGVGVGIPRTIQASFLKQIEYTILTKTTFSTLSLAITGVLVFIGVITTVMYFFFSARRKGALKTVSYIGVVFIMVGFGATFGYTVMGRVSLLIGRLQFLLKEWLHLIS